MIDAISLETAHLLGDALPSAHRLRYRIFVARRNYSVPSHKGMEWDQFDTPAAVYMLWRDEAKRVRAIARLIPTSQPYMIQQLWPDLVPASELPSSDDVWEVTRLGIDRDLDRRRRTRVSGELFCAFCEFGLRFGIDAFIFITHEAIIHNALRKADVDVQSLGESGRLGPLPVVAARVPVSLSTLHNLRRHHGILGPVLRLHGEVTPRAA